MNDTNTAGSDSSDNEHDVLVRIIAESASGSAGFVLPSDSIAATRILEAGFTRAHHDGERVTFAAHPQRILWTDGDGRGQEASIAEAQEALRGHDDIERERDEALGALAQADRRAEASEQERDAAIRERDEARDAFDEANTAHAETHAKLAEAEQDAADFRDQCRAMRTILETPQWIACAERDAAVARAEAAEAKLAKREADLLRVIESVQSGKVAAESRAAALAEALREIAEMPMNDPRDMQVHQLQAIARAALAGNGTGGDGWIACKDRLPEFYGEYVVWRPGMKHGREAHFSSKSWEMIDDDRRLGEFTHWRPLPAPPSAGETRTT